MVLGRIKQALILMKQYSNTEGAYGSKMRWMNDADDLILEMGLKNQEMRGVCVCLVAVRQQGREGMV